MNININDYLTRWAQRKSEDLADAWLDALNAFLTAPTRAVAAEILDRHQDIANSIILRAIDDLIAENTARGDVASNARLRERRGMIVAFRSARGWTS
jgi:hypothetical protein